MKSFTQAEHRKIASLLTRASPRIHRWEYIHTIVLDETGDRFPARYVLYSDYAHWPRGHMVPYAGNIHCLSYDDVVQTVAAIHCKADACLLLNGLSGII